MQKIIKFENSLRSKRGKLKVSIAFLLLFLVILYFQSKFIGLYVDSFLKDLGFSLTEVSINGVRSLKENDIKKHIQYRNCSNLFCIDLASTKNSLEKLDLVKTAHIKLVLPSKLKIKILEEQPRFIIDNGNDIFLLNSDGKKIASFNHNTEKYKNLVLLHGDNVRKNIKNLKVILEQSPDLAKKITSARFISNRRWSLVVSSLTVLDLPEKSPEKAFKKLDLMNKRYGLLSDNLKKIDLRVKNRMIIKFYIQNNNNNESKV